MSTNTVRRECKLWYAGMRRMTSEELRKRDDTVINIFCNEVVAFCSGNTRVLHRVASANTQLGIFASTRVARACENTSLLSWPAYSSTPTPEHRHHPSCQGTRDGDGAREWEYSSTRATSRCYSVEPYILHYCNTV